MKINKLAIIVIAVILLVLVMPTPKKEATTTVMLGDYAGDNGWSSTPMDNALLIQKIEELHANTYAFLIQPPNSYKRFREFLELTKDKHIDIYPYLVPPAESCSNVYPFYCDFNAWAKNIADLSLIYPNIKGWMIDDFYDYAFFTKDYISSFVSTAKSINPALKFYPVVYYTSGSGFSNIQKFYGNTSGVIDGIIFPYINYDGGVCNTIYTTTLNEQIDTFNRLYNQDHAILTLNYPSNTRSIIGEYAQYSLDVSGMSTFTYDYYTVYPSTTEPGYHYIQILLDDQVIDEWDNPFASPKNDITIQLNGAKKLTIKLIDKKSVGNYRTQAVFAAPPGNWVSDTTGSFYVTKTDITKQRWDLIMMVYASKLSSCEGSDVNFIKQSTSIILSRIKDGGVQGIIQYQLPKDNTSIGSKFQSVEELYVNYINENPTTTTTTSITSTTQIPKTNQPPNQPASPVYLWGVLVGFIALLIWVGRQQ